MRGLVLLASVAAVSSLCPMLGRNGRRQLRGTGTPPGHPEVPGLSARHRAAAAANASRKAVSLAEARRNVNWEEVKTDIVALLTDSKPHWPADYGNYGPFFIRMAWHCAGTYRASDGRGGCDGARQRFDPERSWEDNTNLDKARALLTPLKLKHGIGLSWGDLIVLTGTAAIEAMGGPILGFCAGRVDDADGSASVLLGPSAEQEKYFPCPDEGNCQSPLGATTVGLIYVNPEGPKGEPLPAGSAGEVRDTFARMGMNDSETVALIGGGHAFGKTHGACPAGVGPPPKDDPRDPWRGLCGTGIGADAYTSGFEGPWTPNPTSWDNGYFNLLLNQDWRVHVGPAEHFQWQAGNSTGPAPTGPPSHPSQREDREPVMMLTSDISLLHDPADQYQTYVRRFSEDSVAFDHAFANAWYKLTTRDMGPYERCSGPWLPPPQDWQYPLPAAGGPLPDFDAVREDLADVLSTPQPSLPPDYYDGVPDYGPLFVRLAWQCATTFRETDYLGGCNGARIRFTPQSGWPINIELDSALLLLQGVKDTYGAALSWADLIVLAGNVALEQAGARPMAFCGGRTDAPDGAGSADLEPPPLSFDDAPGSLKNQVANMGLSLREFTALMGGHTLGQMHAERSGYTGAWSESPTQFNNGYFTTLLTETWLEHTVPVSGKRQFKAQGKELYLLPTDLMFKYDAELAVHSQDFASDNALFLMAFSRAWTKMMHADRFDGACEARLSAFKSANHTVAAAL